MDFSPFASYISDNENDTQLLHDSFTRQPSPRDPDSQLQKLKQQNRMKQKALQKASSLIDLLNVELAVSKKAFQEAIEELQQELKEAEEREYRLRDQIEKLENDGWSKERKREKESKGKEGARTMQLIPRGSFSFKSEGKLQENTRGSENKSQKKSNYNSPRKLSPYEKRKKQEKQKEKDKEKELSVEYMKVFLSEYLKQDYEQGRMLRNIVKKESSLCLNMLEGVNDRKEEIEMIQMRQQGEQAIGEEGRSFQSLKRIIKEQNQVIESLKKVISEYKDIVHSLLSPSTLKTQTNQSSPQIQILKNLNTLFPSHLRQLKNKYQLSATAHQQQSLVINSPIKSQRNQQQQTLLNIKQLLNINSTAPQKDIILVIESLKSKDERLIGQNKELIEIIEGLLKYIQL